jgi:hypothetical protein
VKLVVDASVAAKWLVPEVLSGEAVGLLSPDNELLRSSRNACTNNTCR